METAIQGLGFSFACDENSRRLIHELRDAQDHIALWGHIGVWETSILAKAPRFPDGSHAVHNEATPMQ